MLEKIIAADKELLIFLNGLGSTTYDPLWIIITNQLCWIPFYVVLFYLLYKKIGKQSFWLAILFIAVLLLVSDQTCNLFKNGFQRLRPCNDETINHIIRLTSKRSPTFSFYSGHAATSTAAMMFVFLFFKKILQICLFNFLVSINFCLQQNLSWIAFSN